MKKLVLFLICISSLAFSDTRFRDEAEENENVLIEILEILKQIKDQNEKLVKISQMIHEIANRDTYNYFLDEPIHEATLD